MPDRDAAARDCLRAAKLMYARGMVNAYEGNVSVRLEKTLLITPSAVCKEELEPEDLVEVDLATSETVSARPGRIASSELKLHLTVYRSRADVGGVAHAHPPFATAFAIRGAPIETRAYPELMVLYDRIPVCRYGRPGTDAVNDEVPAALEGHDAFLLSNHGLVAVADDAITAAYRLEGVESIAKVLTLARLTGGEKDLGDAECAGIAEIYWGRRKL